jgi:hypothetical protein
MSPVHPHSHPHLHAPHHSDALIRPSLLGVSAFVRMGVALGVAAALCLAVYGVIG